MNIFRFIADGLHLISFFILIFKIRDSRQCYGISYKTQEMYLVVFLTRYWDLFLYFVSLYNTCMKVLYISATVYTIYLIRYKKPICLVNNKNTYEPNDDVFPHYKFLYPAAIILALIFHSSMSAFEISWSFSIWLESVAILPQLHMIQKCQEVEVITGKYMAALGFYRFFYILNWIYKYFLEGTFSWVSALGGILQTVLYADFLYIYITAKKSGKSIALPV